MQFASPLLFAVETVSPRESAGSGAACCTWRQVCSLCGPGAPCAAPGDRCARSAAQVLHVSSPFVARNMKGHVHEGPVLIQLVFFAASSKTSLHKLRTFYSLRRLIAQRLVATPRPGLRHRVVSTVAEASNIRGRYYNEHHFDHMGLL